MQETKNGLNGLPIWARLITLVGVPSTIAIYLVWTITRAFTLEVVEIRRASEAAALRFLQHMEDTREGYARTTKLLLALCVNLARSPEEQQRCVE